MSKIIKVTIGNNVSRDSKMISNDTTLRAALENAGIDYTIGMTSLDGATLKAGDLDKTFEEFGIEDKCYLLNVVKADNAAAIKVAGKAVVVESAFSPDAIKLVAKHRPKALSLFEDKEEVFKVTIGAGSGDISQWGAVYGAATTADGKATITMLMPDGVTDPKAWVADKVSTAILKLKKVEDNLPGVIAEIEAELEAINSNITIM